MRIGCLPHGTAGFCTRHQNVLKLASERAGWGKPLPAGHFHGVAVHKHFGTVSSLKWPGERGAGPNSVHQVTCAVDCGLVINPDIVAQMESRIVFGLTAALYGEITFKDGQVQQSNFHDYPMLRMNETPIIDVIVVQSDESPTGVGEPGYHRLRQQWLTRCSGPQDSVCVACP